MRLGFLLPLTFGLLLFHLLGTVSSWRLGRRERGLYALLCTGVYLVAITEALSAFHHLDTLWVTVFWNLGAMGLVAAQWHLAKSTTARPQREGAWKQLAAAGPLGQVLLFFILVLLGLSAVLAAFATPSGWDSMTYHLSRMAHWWQNRSIGIYATNCMYQNQHSPFAEWSMLHLTLLQGNDHLVNFVQWTSFVGSIVVVSLLTEACGGSRMAGMVAAFLVATMPVALLQASTTENDGVVAFLVLCVAYGCVRAGQEPRIDRVVFVGVALGLALLTKATAYLFVPFFLLWLAVVWLRKGVGPALLQIAVVGAIALVLNAGYYARNFETSGTWLGKDHDSGPGYGYENETHRPGAMVSSLLRNFSLQTPENAASRNFTVRVVKKLHRWMGVDPSDPRTTSYAPYYYIPGGAMATQCPNPLHVLLFIISCGAMLIFWRRFGVEPKLLIVGIVLGAFVFCAILKWQPFHSRLHLPLLLLAMPVAAIALETLACRFFTLLWIGLVLPTAFAVVLYSHSQPLLGRPNIFTQSRAVQRFSVRPDDRLDFEAAFRFFREHGVGTVGVIGPVNNSGWEYPLFDPDEMNFGYPWRVEPVLVENSYASLESDEVPDAVVLLEPGGAENITVHGQAFQRVLHGHTMSVYGKEPLAAEQHPLQ